MQSLGLFLVNVMFVKILKTLYIICHIVPVVVGVTSVAFITIVLFVVDCNGLNSSVSVPIGIGGSVTALVMFVELQH